MGIHEWGSRNILDFALFFNISKYLKNVVPFYYSLLGDKKTVKYATQKGKEPKEKRTCLLAH